jgi:O-antigen ligase
VGKLTEAARPMHFILRQGKVGTTAVLTLIMALIIGVLSAAFPVMMVTVVCGFVCVVCLLLLYNLRPQWFITTIIASLFFNPPLPLHTKVLDSTVKIVMALVIAFSLLMFPSIIKRSTPISAWKKLMVVSILSLLATCISVEEGRIPTLLYGALYGLESVLAFFLFSLYVFGTIRTWVEISGILNKLALAMTVGIGLKLIFGLTKLSMMNLNKNTFGFLLDMIIPLALVASQHVRSKTWVTLLTLAIAAILLDDSRGSLISIGIALMMYLFWINAHGRKTIFYYTIGLIGLLCTIPFIPSKIINRLMSLGDLHETAQLTRIQLWSTAIPVFKSHPFFGIGSYNFSYYFQNYYVYSSYEQFFHPHNTYLNVLVSTGVAGTLCFILTASYLMVHVWRGVTTRTITHSWYFVGLFLGILALCIHGLVDSSLLPPQTLLLLSVLSGIAFKGVSLQKEESVLRSP